MKKLMVMAAILCLCSAAHANLVTGFEDYNATAQGVTLTGQHGWTLPTGSVDYKVYTYAGNTFNFPPNPEGGSNFIAGKSMGVTTGYARAEHPNDFSAGGQWLFSFDMSAQYNGTLPAEDYLGSFSCQPSTTNRYFQTLNIWNDYNNPVAFKTNYITNENPLPGISPGAAWSSLQVGHWYREKTMVNFTTNLITMVSIQDLTAGSPPTVVNPSGWHLNLPSAPLPTAIRFFAGGAVGGNTQAWDNLSVIPEPSSVVLIGLGLMTLLRRR
jgi:hypothetical protein